MREFSVPASFRVGEHDNIVSSVFSHERNDPDHVIFQRLVDGAWTDVTCAQAAGQIRSAALGLIAEGVQPGDRVAMLSATRYEWPILDLAILSIGALTVPIYETSSAEQVRFVLADSGAVLVLAETEGHADTIEQLKGELPDLRKVLRIDGSGPSGLDALAEAGKTVDPTSLDERLAGIRAVDPATLIYTASKVMILIFEWLFRGRPIGGREVFGTALAIAGRRTPTIHLPFSRAEAPRRATGRE